MPVVRGNIIFIFGVLAGAGDIDNGAGKAILLIKCKHQIDEGIRAGFVVAEVGIRGISIHPNMSIHSVSGVLQRSGTFGKIVKDQFLLITGKQHTLILMKKN